MPNYTNIIKQFLEQIWKMPNHKRGRPKDCSSIKYQLYQALRAMESNIFRSGARPVCALLTAPVRALRFPAV